MREFKESIQKRSTVDVSQETHESSVDEAANELDGAMGGDRVTIHRAEPGRDQFDDMDFIDMTVNDATVSSPIFEIIVRHGFTDSIVVKASADGQRQVVQIKRS